MFKIEAGRRYVLIIHSASALYTKQSDDLRAAFATGGAEVEIQWVHANGGSDTLIDVGPLEKEEPKPATLAERLVAEPNLDWLVDAVEPTSQYMLALLRKARDIGRTRAWGEKLLDRVWPGEDSRRRLVRLSGDGGKNWMPGYHLIDDPRNDNEHAVVAFGSYGTGNGVRIPRADWIIEPR